MIVDASSSRLEQERHRREAFVRRRLGHDPDSLESMDLTRFMHGGPGRLLRCRVCGLGLREEDEEAKYQADRYDTELMRHLYPRYLQAFRKKRSGYRPLLRPGAEVLEVGSHLGAFLQTAEEWGWRPTGLDVGEFTSAFGRREGFSVKRMPLEDYSPRLKRPDAIFVWNCFEQLEDPFGTLRRSHQLLNRHGVLVVRVPNAAFYRAQRRNLETTGGALRTLGLNNLLGFPYLHGYTPATLTRLLRSMNFEPLAAHNSSLLTPPYPDLSATVREEWRNVRREAVRSTAIDGPWIEIVSRRVDSGSSRKPL